jgi:hypothetical protein
MEQGLVTGLTSEASLFWGWELLDPPRLQPPSQKPMSNSAALAGRSVGAFSQICDASAWQIQKPEQRW